MRALSPRVLRELRGFLAELADPNGDAFGVWVDRASRLLPAVDAALAPKRGVKAARKEKRAKVAGKKEDTAAIRAYVVERARGVCECGCGKALTEYDPGELDHFFGRHRRTQAVTNTWLLSHGCHVMKTNGLPSAAVWHERFIAHAKRCAQAADRLHDPGLLGGYLAAADVAEARLFYVQARAALPHGRATP